VKEYLKCDDCGREDETVVETYCPFAWEINDKKVEMNLCPQCRENRADDI